MKALFMRALNRCQLQCCPAPRLPQHTHTHTLKQHCRAMSVSPTGTVTLAKKPPLCRSAIEKGDLIAVYSNAPPESLFCDD